jgi:ankyrin repeat protein
MAFKLPIFSKKQATAEPDPGPAPGLVDARGFEFWRFQRDAQRAHLTQEQFDDLMNNPDFYEIEVPSHESHLKQVAGRARGVPHDDFDLLHLAVGDRSLREVNRLLTAGCSPDALDREGRTPLFYAIRDGEDGIAEALIRAGSNVNIQDFHGESPLHYASRLYRPHLAQILLQRRSRVDAADIHGNTPLWSAVWSSTKGVEIFKILLANGADRAHKNLYGVSPEALANRLNREDARQCFGS